MIVSVAINHATGKLWPRGQVYDVPIVNGLLGGGAVSVFFVVGAFIVTMGLLRDLERGTLDPMRFYLRRIVRLGAQLVLLCGAVALVLRIEGGPTYDGRVVVHNVMHVLTYTYNVFGRQDFFEVEGEFGHLWYLSVQQQCYLVLPLVLALLGRRRLTLMALLTVLIALTYQHRQDVLGDGSGWIFASTLTTTRADGLIWGVVVALAIPFVARWRWPTILWISLVALLALKLVLPMLGDFAFLGPWSLAFTLVAGVTVAAVWQTDQPTRAARFLSWGPLTQMGRASLTIFIWHLPVFIVVARHTTSWHWTARTLLALAIVTVVVVLMERFVEQRVRHLLATRSVFRMRPGRQAAP